jgi:4-amino-4-deoxy-L-arabinose transferase-like glycosyltransferase
MTSRWWGIFVLALACAALLLTAPTHGDFWWYEAPSHAMNGVFVHDFIAAMPLHDPVGFAIDYYLRYPGVTILFYPPLFPFIEAVFFAIFGVSHFVAQLAVCAMLLFYALGLRELARNWLPEPAAVAVGLVGLGLPIVTYWGRQVMLEMPAYAFLVWSTVFLVSDLKTPRAMSLFGAVLCFVLALYVKQTAAFFGFVIAIALLMRDGFGVFRRRAVWGTAIFGIVALLPLLAITLRFGATNADLATGAMEHMPILSAKSLLFYAAALPDQLGWSVLVLAVVFLLLQTREGGWRDPLLLVGLLTVIVGYIFFTPIAVKDERYTVFLLGPLAVFAVAALYRLASRYQPSPHLASAICLVFAVAVFGYGTLAVAVPRVDGFREAAEYVGAHAPANSTVLFLGRRSAAFVFDLRALGTRPDLAVMRGEKMLVRYKSGRQFGATPLPLSRADIEGFFPNYRIGYAVVQSGFWDDLAPVATMFAVLNAPPCVTVATIPITANVLHDDNELRIVRNDGALAATAAPFAYDMPMIGTRFSGSAKSETQAK